MLVDVRRRALASSPYPRCINPATGRMTDRRGAAPDHTARFRGTPACHSRPRREENISPRPGRLRARVVDRRWGQDPDGDARNRGQSGAGRETEHG
jgi:hypothetical protein